METNTIEVSTKPFVKVAREFLESLIAQRRKLIDNNESRISKKAALDAIDIISRHLQAYNYTNETIARFIINHFNTISLIVPGSGSSCHIRRTNELLKIYNQAIIINTSSTMKKFSYYFITNNHGEAFVKTSVSDCTVASLTYEGKSEIKQFDTNYKKFNGDVAVEITKDVYLAGLKKIVDRIKKDSGI